MVYCRLLFFCPQARQILEREYNNLLALGTDRRLDEVSKAVDHESLLVSSRTPIDNYIIPDLIKKVKVAGNHLPKRFLFSLSLRAGKLTLTYFFSSNLTCFHVILLALK